MSRTRAFIEHELRLHGRSLRSRFVGTAWILGALALPVIAYLSQDDRFMPASAQMAEAVHVALPLLSFLGAIALSIDAITRERDEGSLQVLGIADITNAGYVLRRFVATCLPCLALSLIPVLAVMVLSVARGSTPLVAGLFLWPWLLIAAPATIFGCALGQAFGTFAGGTILAVIEGVLAGALLLTLGNDLLALGGRHVDGPAEFLVGRDLVDRLQWLGSVETEFASDAPSDLLLNAEWSLAFGTFLAVFAAASLGISIAFLRRSQPDVRPWRIPPQHPLRGFLGWINAARLSMLPDPGLTRGDLAAIASCLAMALALVVVMTRRHDHYRELGLTRYSVERDGKPEPTSVDLATKSWSVTGALARDGDWDGRFELAFTNRGTNPIDRLACSLAASLAVERMESPSRVVTPRRIWDRLELVLAPPVLAGEDVMITGIVQGRATEAVLPQARLFRSYDRFWETMGGSRHSSGMIDMSRGLTWRAASPSAIALRSDQIAPVPRYETWKIQTYGVGYNSWTAIPTDDIATNTRVHLAIDVDNGVFIADTCGHVTRAQDDGSARMEGDCVAALPTLELRGGRLVALNDLPPSIAAFAVLPGHVEEARLHAPQLVSVSQSAAAAWPGLDIPPLAILEVPPNDMWNESDYGSRGAMALGSLMRVSEPRLLAREPIDTSRVAADAISKALLAKRPVSADELLFFRHLYRNLASARLGSAVDSAAFESTMGNGPDRYASKLLTARSWDALGWGTRLPALLRMLRARVGDERLATATDAFLARDGKGDARELFAMIGEQTRVPLDAFYDDFIAGDAVPQLTLEEVAFTHDAVDWRVTGRVRNLGTGRVSCPVVVRTDASPASLDVDVPSQEAVPFLIETPDRPRLVLLDPLGDCFRYRPKNGIGIVERVEHDRTK